MGRAERPLNADAGPVQALAAELRSLRDQAGRPTYEALARKAGASKSSLSEAAGGRKFPSLDTTLAYVRGCNGDEVEWAKRWHATNRALTQSSLQSPVSLDEASAARMIGSPRRRYGAAAVVVAAAIAASIAVFASSASPRQPSAAVASGAPDRSAQSEKSPAAPRDASAAAELRDLPSPVKVAAVILERDPRQGGTYVFQERLLLSTGELWAQDRALFTNYDPTRYDRWFRSRGAVDPYMSVTKLVLEGNRASPVQILGMGVIKKCARPLNGTIFVADSQGGGDNISIAFDLDKLQSTARDFRDHKLGAPYFAEHTISLARGERQTLQVYGITRKLYCEFRLTLTVLDGDKQVTQVVDNHGDQFRVTAVLDGPPSAPYSPYKVAYLNEIDRGSETGPYFVRVDPATFKRPTFG